VKREALEKLRKEWAAENPHWFCTIECERVVLCNKCKKQKEFPPSMMLREEA
jgi:hypothetical protein